MVCSLQLSLPIRGRARCSRGEQQMVHITPAWPLPSTRHPEHGPKGLCFEENKGQRLYSACGPCALASPFSTLRARGSAPFLSFRADSLAPHWARWPLFVCTRMQQLSATFLPVFQHCVELFMNVVSGCQIR